MKRCLRAAKLSVALFVLLPAHIEMSAVALGDVTPVLKPCVFSVVAAYGLSWRLCG